MTSSNFTKGTSCLHPPSQLMSNIIRAPMALILVDFQLKILYLTPSPLHILNFKDLGKSLITLFKKIPGERLIEDCYFALENNSHITRFLDIESKGFYIRQLIPYYNAEAGISGIIIALVDVTSLYEASSNLEDNLQKLHHSINLIPYLFTYIDKNERYRFSNKAHSEWMGIPCAEIQGKRMGELLSPQNYRNLKPYIDRVLTGAEVKFEGSNVDSSGKVKDYEVIYIPDFDNEGTVKGFFASVHEVTEHKKKERIILESKKQLENLVKGTASKSGVHFFKSAVENLAQALAVKCALIGKISNDGRKVESLAIYSRGKHLEPFSYDLNLSTPCELILRDGIAYIAKDARSFYPDSRLLAMINAESYIGLRLTNSNNKLIGIIACLDYAPMDISEKQWQLLSIFSSRVSAEIERQETIEKLAKSNKALESFAYVCSHDLQEPARTIANFATLLEDTVKEILNEEEKQYLKLIISASNHMQEMIKGILIYSQLDQDAVEKEQVSLNEVMEAVCDNLSVLIQSRNAIITHDPLPTLWGNKIHFIQIFQNIIGNAIKFTQAKTPEVYVKVEEKKFEWILSIQDNGMGIPQKYLDEIFKIFKQLNKREEYEGTGIGLSICRKIIENHGGKIWCESTPGKGTTFYFSLPKIF